VVAQVKANEVHPNQKMLDSFSPNEINKLPRYVGAEDKPRKSKCNICNGYHGEPSIHLDYVGHAAMTKRLLEVDMNWTWEPFAIGTNGLPQLDADGGLWIRLTINGVTRIGYGDKGTSRGTQAIKEAIGDALRNAAMRFGGALELWHKGDLFDADIEKGTETVTKPLAVLPTKAVVPITGDMQKVCEGIYSQLLDTTTKDELRTLFSTNESAMDVPFTVEDGSTTTLRECFRTRADKLA
jgi:hypothetical protein